MSKPGTLIIGHTPPFTDENGTVPKYPTIQPEEGCVKKEYEPVQIGEPAVPSLEGVDLMTLARHLVQQQSVMLAEINSLHKRLTSWQLSVYSTFNDYDTRITKTEGKKDD